MVAQVLRTIADYKDAALSKLSAGLSDYIQKTAGEGKTFAANLQAFSHYKLLPRYLQGVQKVDTHTQILGKKASAPLMIAPTAWHKMFCANGEKDTSDAAKSAGIPYIISSFSTLDFPQIGKNLTHAWYQLLMYKDKSLMKKYIAKAEKAGCSAIVLTIDAPLGCSMCASSASTTEKVHYPIHKLPLFPEDPRVPYATFDEYYTKYMGSDASWKDIAEIKSLTKLPLVLKGILHPADAQKAVQIGAKAIIISNHGGRQLDDTISTLDALAMLPEDVKKKIDVYVDGGIRSGTDIFKALALGAKAVAIGRPALYGLAVDGKKGLEAVIDIFEKELQTCMHMTGCATIKDISKDRLYKVCE